MRLSLQAFASFRSIPLVLPCLIDYPHSFIRNCVSLLEAKMHQYHRAIELLESEAESKEMLYSRCSSHRKAEAECKKLKEG